MQKLHKSHLSIFSIQRLQKKCSFQILQNQKVKAHLF